MRPLLTYCIAALIGSRMRGLAEVCRVLNAHGVNYLVIGAHACALHGHIRATEDYDFLVENNAGNLGRTSEALNELFPHLEQSVTPRDISDNVVLKVADDIEVDVSVSAWSVTYDEASQD